MCEVRERYDEGIVDTFVERIVKDHETYTHTHIHYTNKRTPKRECLSESVRLCVCCLSHSCLRSL